MTALTFKNVVVIKNSSHFRTLSLTSSKWTKVNFGNIHNSTLLLQDEYIGLASSAAGVRVSIHEPKTTIFPEEQGFDAAVGAQFRGRKSEMVIYYTFSSLS